MRLPFGDGNDGIRDGNDGIRDGGDGIRDGGDFGYRSHGRVNGPGGPEEEHGRNGCGGKEGAGGVPPGGDDVAATGRNGGADCVPQPFRLGFRVALKEFRKLVCPIFTHVL